MFKLDFRELSDEELDKVVETTLREKRKRLSRTAHPNVDDDLEKYMLLFRSYVDIDLFGVLHLDDNGKFIGLQEMPTRSFGCFQDAVYFVARSVVVYRPFSVYIFHNNPEALVETVVAQVEHFQELLNAYEVKFAGYKYFGSHDSNFIREYDTE